MDASQVSQTEWNGGTLTNIRIHNIREQLLICGQTRDIQTWHSLLVQLNHEVYGFQTKEQKEQIRTELEKIIEAINKYQQAASYARRYNKTITIPNEIILSLNNMQYTLDEIFHSSGLQTALKDDAGDAF